MPRLQRAAAMVMALDVGMAWDSFCSAPGWKTVWFDEFTLERLEGAARGTWRRKDLGVDLDVTQMIPGQHVYMENCALMLRFHASWNGSAWVNASTSAVDNKAHWDWQGPTRVCVLSRAPTPEEKPEDISPTHWLMPNNASCWPCHGDLDVMDMVNGAGVLWGTYRWCSREVCGEGRTKPPWSAAEIVAANWPESRHEYGLEYDGAAHVVFAVDGEIRALDSVGLLFHPLLFDAPPVQTFEGMGAPEESCTLPTYHQLDYVRVATPDMPHAAS